MKPTSSATPINALRISPWLTLDVAVRRRLEPAVEAAEEAAQQRPSPSVRGRSSIADSAGDSVSALNAEIITEIAIVIANCLFSRP